MRKIPFREGLSDKFVLTGIDDCDWTTLPLYAKDSDDVVAVHRVPTEPFVHFIDIDASCLCGVELDVLAWHNEVENVPFVWHQPLDPLYYW